MLTYRELTKEQVEFIYYNHMQEDFPPAEVKPLAVLLDLLERGAYRPFGWYEEDGTLIAYSFFAQAPQRRVMLLDYFAICRPYRSKGYGSFCLEQMKEMLGDTIGLLAEVEDPAESRSAEELDTRTRRVRFYQRNGLVATNVRSILFGVPYIIHYYALQGPCADIRAELDAAYHTLFPQPVYEANAKIWTVEGEA